jgi:flagellar hook-associated protein 1 FlgK
MSNFSIGLSGIDAAQKALEVIGNNVANAATEGYHRQRIELSPAYANYEGEILLGGGVKVEGITRMIDGLLEQEILRNNSILERISSEIGTLRTVENALGELSTESGGLNAAIDRFFSALQDLSAHPDQPVWQNQAVSAAQTMAGQFRTLGEFLTSLDTQIRLEAENAVEVVNTTAAQIAELNHNIKRLEIDGGTANNLRDQRDQLINNLAKLLPVQTQSREYGVVDVSVAGIPLVMGTAVVELETGLDENGRLGISVVGNDNYLTDVQGGRIGALLSLKNELIAGVHDDLDSLAGAIIQEINRYHVQGVGAAGSFTQLTGWAMPSENLADFDPPVTDGKIYIRVTNTGTGAITRHEIDVDASADSLTTIAADISAITGLDAWVASSRLSISADAGYKFDFLPCVLAQPTASSLTGASPPTVSVSGVYTGPENQTFTFTVVGDDSVGNGNLQLAVTDGNGDAVTTLNVGSGYAAGDLLDLSNGIRVSLGIGDLVSGDTFEVDAFAGSDTSGVLAAVGINTFFSGKSTSDIAVSPEISATPGRVATARGAEMTDNANALQMAELKDQAIADLNSLTCGGFYRRLVTDVGQQLSLRQMRQDNLETMIQNLVAQKADVSGVDINEEAAQLLVFEQMFQAMAKYISTIQSSLSSLMEIV